MSRLALLGVAALAIAASSLVATASARASTLRVLAIRFGPDLAVNPLELTVTHR